MTRLRALLLASCTFATPVAAQQPGVDWSRLGDETVQLLSEYLKINTTIPPILTGATDRPSYQRVGILTYGFDPFKVERADNQKGVHGNDERISVANVHFGVKYLFDVLRYTQ